MDALDISDTVEVTKDGVIDYPLYTGMPLVGVWSVVPASNGPAVAAADGFLHYSVTNMAGWNLWVYVSIATTLPARGSLLTFRVRANTIQGSEVKFTVADGLILRFTNGGRDVNWQWFDSNGRFQTLSPSSVRADGIWHTVTMVFSPTSVSLLEDGRYLFNWVISRRDQIQPVFHMQVLDTGVSMSFDVDEIYSVPPTYADGVSTPWDYAFRADAIPPIAAISTVASPGGPQISYGDGYARFSAKPVTMGNITATMSVQQVTPPVSVQIYRLRINEAGGDETKVTFPGGQVLRRAGGKLNWQYYTSSGTWQTLAASDIAVGSPDYTIIALATSATAVTVYENGTFRYTFPLPGGPVTQWQPSLWVQQLTAGTNVSVDLGGIRTLPVIKTLELLATDLRESMLAFFPLIGDYRNILGNSGDLVPVGGQVPFVTSPFGVGANFAGGQAALSIPPLAVATSTSYTLSAWVKVNGYPAAGSVTGIAGSLLLDSTGHLVFRFLYNGGDGMYQEQRYTSNHTIPTGDWHNVVVTYSYEESRLGIFLDGRLHCLEYLSGPLTTASTSVPSAFFVGGDQAAADASLVVLNGAVSMVMILTEHVHQPTMAVFTDKPVPVPASAPAADLEVASPEAAGLFFVFVAIAVLAVVVRVVWESRYTQNTTEYKTTYPPVDKLVTAIVSKAGAPARPGVRVSRNDIGSPNVQTIQLDIGGEGRLDVGGLVTGFTDAINVNAVKTAGDPRPPTVTAPGRLKGKAIPNLVELAPWDTNPGLPFSDGFASTISMINAPLTNRNVEEIARVIMDGGTIDLWLDNTYLPAIQDLASRVGSTIQTLPELPEFQGNGHRDNGTWFTRRTIVAHKAGAGNQPYTPVWYPDALLVWDPATDANAIFNRSKVPLAERAWNADLRANASAKAGQGDLMALASFGPTAQNPSQGAAGSANYYTFSYWQYVGILVFWGGSAGEGIILAPNPTVIDAAHRNGVPVYGNVFFPPASYGGRLDWVRQFTDSRMPSKLVQAAQYFGFDGWFVNQETDSPVVDRALASAVQNTLLQARALAPNLKFIWYDAMTKDGQVRWQGALNDNNAMFFQSGSTRVSDSMFLDFRWSPGTLASSAAYAAQLNRSGFDLYAGVDVEAKGTNVPQLAQVFPASGNRNVSAGIHRPDWTYNGAKADIASFYQRESMFWVGSAGDPSKTPAGVWRAPAVALAERTPITKTPFATSFNTGQGLLYAVDGTKLSSTPWNNIGLQDVLPTYRWMVSGPNTITLTPKLDFDDAYNGGTSLLLAGAVEGQVLVRLYQTRLTVTGSTQVLVTLKAAGVAPLSMQLAATFAGRNDPVYYDLGSGTSDTWRTVTVGLGGNSGQVLLRLDVRIATPTRNNDYRLRIGQLAVIDQPQAAAAPTNVELLGKARTSPTTQTIRLRWTAPAGPVRHYNLYRRNPDNSRTYLGGTSNDAYFIPLLTRVGSETTTLIDIETVGPTFARSAPVSMPVSW